MKVVSANRAQAKLLQLIDEIAASHTPLMISGARNNAVLVSAADWAGIQETLFLLSIPEMRESIKNGMNEPVDDCSSILRW